MKKFLFVVIAICAMSFAACGHQTAASNSHDTTTVSDSVNADSISMDSDSVVVK